MRFSLIYEDVQAARAASIDSDHADKPLRGHDSDDDLDTSQKKADREPTEPTEPRLQRQK